MSQRTCTIPECEKPGRSRGWCSKHYERWKRHGNPYATAHRATCTVKDCTNRHKARGFCRLHYDRWATHSDPEMSLINRAKNIEHSISMRSKLSGNCLEWTGTKDSKGYGMIHLEGGKQYIHRYIWVKTRGPIPAGIHIDHICHNVACFNIEHLRLATPSQNLRNRSGATANSTSGFRNVHKSGKRWVVVVVKDKKHYNYGHFDDVNEAAEVAHIARQELYGEYAGKG